MKEVTKIALTNWINVLAACVCIFTTLFIYEVAPGIAAFNEALSNAFGSLLVYYLVFWLGFPVIIALLDAFLFGFNRAPQYTKYKLALEWLLISSPFIYWLIKYNQWIFLVAILAFLMGQYLRRAYIFKILRQR